MSRGGERRGEAGRPGGPAFVFETGTPRPAKREAVPERPLTLTVNGNPLATLIASPHDPAFLVAGFLRMQGLVSTREDIEVLGVCPDSGSANVRIRGEVPDRLIPVITSGCGGGLSFHLPGREEAPRRSPDRPAPARTGEAGGRGGPVEREGIYSADEIFSTMDALALSAHRYREGGGIHSAAAGGGRTLLVCAEDIGRHNAVDRVAGEALLQGIDLRRTILATSGRVSSEMAAKAAALGAAVIASRTAPTDLAVRICEDRGIALAGYVRGRRLTVYAHPWRIVPGGDERRIDGVTGVILAGGASRRMGRNKALLALEGRTLIEVVYRRMESLFREVLIATNEPGLFDFLSCRKVPDLFPGAGSLAGIHAGLRHASADFVFVAACDMPRLDGAVVRYLASLRGEYDAVLPGSDRGLEPLCALYGKGALGAIERALRDGRNRIVGALDGVRTKIVPREEVARIDPDFDSFRNVNTPEDYAALAGVDPPRSEAGAGSGRDAGLPAGASPARPRD